MPSPLIRRCSVSEIAQAPNIGVLLSEYGEESRIAGIGEQCAQLDAYAQMEAAGLLHLVGAFLGDELVGFVLLLATVLPHYGKKIATTESLFVAKAARKSGAGLRLLRAAEQVAREIGAVGLLVSAPIGGQLEQVLPRAGYQATNRVFFRGLA